MKTRTVNRKVIEQTSFDSGSPGGLSVVVHHFAEAGEFTVSFVENERVMERVQLGIAAAPEMEGTTEASARRPAHTTIDLDSIRKGTARQESAELGQTEEASASRQRFAMDRHGYVSFMTPVDNENIAVTAEHTGRDKKIFDSRRLDAADVFAVTLMRPGRYVMKNTLANYEGTVTVSYPVIGKEPYRPPEPVTIECNKSGFSTATVALKPAQGLIFKFNVPSRIKIDLVEPDDGPREKQKMQGETESIKNQRPVVRYRKYPKG